ncbi:PadR family transcriptional regulator [candidate division KSB1 bacterium]
MKKLTINEEIFLIAIWHLRGDAYGVRIREQIKDLSGQTLLLGTLYNTLDNLVKKGYVSTKKGEPTNQRGGHNKVFYRITERGSAALNEARELHNRLWENIPDNAFGGI